MRSRLTQLLLVFAVGALAVKLLGGSIGTPLLLTAIPILAGWTLITALTVGAGWSALLLVPTTVVVGWTFLDECDAILAFGGGRSCAVGDPPPTWHDTLAWVVPLIAGVIGVVVIGYYARRWYAARRMSPLDAIKLEAVLRKAQHAAQEVLSTNGSADANEAYRGLSDSFVRAVIQQYRPLRRKRLSMLISIVLTILVVAFLWVAGHWLLTDGDHTALIDATATLHEWRAAVYLVGLPIVFLILSIARLAFTTVRSRVGALRGPVRWSYDLEDRVAERRVNTAILWYRWRQLPRVNKKVTNSMIPGVEPYRGRKETQRDFLPTTEPASTPTALDASFDTLSDISSNCARVARTLIPRSERGWRALGDALLTWLQKA